MRCVAVRETPPPAQGLVVTISPMHRRHLRGVMAIETNVHVHPWSEDLFLSELSRPASRTYLVARVGALQVGHAGILHVVDEGHITTVAVDPQWQRRQVATRLMSVLYRNGLARGTETLTLEVRITNTGAQALYRLFGFVPAGIRKGYYSATATHPAEDGLIMSAHDIDSPEMLDRLASAEETIKGSTVVEEVDHVE